MCGYEATLEGTMYMWLLLRHSAPLRYTFAFLTAQQVTTPIGSFQPAVASASKKLAKSQAAHAALQGLGLVETTFGYSAS